MGNTGSLVKFLIWVHSCPNYKFYFLFFLDPKFPLLLRTFQVGFSISYILAI